MKQDIYNIFWKIQHQAETNALANLWIENTNKLLKYSLIVL